MALSLLSIASTASSALSIDSMVLGRRRPSTAASFLHPLPLRNHQRITVVPHRRVFSGVRLFQHSRFPSLTLASAAKIAESNSNLDSVAEDAVDCCTAATRRGIRFVVVAAACACACVMFVVSGQRALAAAESVGVGVLGLKGQFVLPKGLGQKLMQVLHVCKDQGLILAALLGLSAFFSMAETAITTLWPWKIRELAEKEPENGVFRMLRSDVTRFLTTILIGTTVVNIAATALVTEAATAIFGEAGVSAATGVMTVAILLLTEITPKSLAVHNATEVARFVARPVAWLSVFLYPVGRVVTFLSMGMLKMLGLKGRSEPYVTEDELKLMLRGAELSGAIEEEEQDMIENVLEIKDTHVREVMSPLVDVVAIDATATLIDFQQSWETHQYSRVPVFEERIDNIIGIAYAMDMLECVGKVDKLKEATVREITHPTYFVPDSMSVWNLLREFRIRKVHMAVVLNEYGGTVGIVTLEDVVEEIVGEIFDENDSKEEIQKKTGYIVMQDDGTFDVDANTSIDQLSEELNVKIPEGHQYEMVSGFICESFGYIPEEGAKIVVHLERASQEENSEYTDKESDNHDEKEKHQTFELEEMDEFDEQSQNQPLTINEFDEQSQNQPLTINEIDENFQICLNEAEGCEEEIEGCEEEIEGGEEDIPYVGLKFSSAEEAYDFYNIYAERKGFSIRKSDFARLKNGEVSSRLYVCNREGFKSMTDKRQLGKEIKRRRNERIGCLARMKIHNNIGVWSVQIFDDVHNHDMLSTPSKARLLRSHNTSHLDPTCKRLFDQFHSCGEGPSKIAKLVNATSECYKLEDEDVEHRLCDELV